MGVPQVNFALDTYECIVIYPGSAGRALPAETVQRLQAEHAEHMQALQRRGIILVAGSVDGPAREPARLRVNYSTNESEKSWLIITTLNAAASRRSPAPSPA